MAWGRPGHKPLSGATMINFLTHRCFTRPQWFNHFYGFKDIMGHVHDDVIKWKHFPRYWPFVWEIHRWPVNFPHKGQWRGALMFSLICAWANNHVAGDSGRHSAHHDVIVIPKRYALGWDFVGFSCGSIMVHLPKSIRVVSLASGPSASVAAPRNVCE